MPCPVIPRQGFFIFVFKPASHEKRRSALPDLPRPPESGYRLAAGNTGFDLGAAWAVVDNPDVISSDRILRVDDSLQTLQDLASMHRKSLKATVIGITGSNGKTTTKELIGLALSSSFPTFITPGNLNNHIGVPLTLLSIPIGTRFAVVEMGANHRGEIAALCGIARPDYGLITNIGLAHLEGFGGPEGVALGKSELYRFIENNGGKIFLHIDDEKLLSLSRDLPKITYGASTQARCRGRLVQAEPYLSLEWMFDGLSGKINTSLYGRYNFENVLAAICIGLYFGAEPEPITRAIESYIPSNNRSQLIQTKNNTLRLDAYNANPSSMKAALASFLLIAGKDSAVIVGDMMELGEYSRREHQEVARWLAQSGIQTVILVGELFHEAASGMNLHTFRSLAEASRYLQSSSITGKQVLIKGSRKMELEKLVSYL